MSAFDIIFDKTLSVTQGGVERALTVDEALQLQTYQAALKGSKMAIRHVLKMIEKREHALAKDRPRTYAPGSVEIEYDSDNADEALRILDIASILDSGHGGYWDRHPMIATWAAQAAISRPGRRPLNEKAIQNIKLATINSERLKWPRRRGS